jgi:hypothetical protein
MIQTFEAVKDGGERTTFKSGAQRERPVGKGRFDLIPAVPLIRLAIHYENGARKYADRNWEKGLPLSGFIKSMFSHIVAYMGGDRTEDHLAAIAWNAFGFIHTEEMVRLGKLPAELADFPQDGPLSSTPKGVTTRAHGLLNGSGAVRGAHRPRPAGDNNRPRKARARQLPRKH